MKKVLFVLMLSTAVVRAQSDNIFSDLLSQHVIDGHVDYEELCQNDHLQTYISQLAQSRPDSLRDKKDKLAFWINAYNAYTLKIICDNFPLKSINELHTGGLYLGSIIKKTVWHKKFAVVNGEKLSLNDIEHEIIRKKFADPRIHFAVVCASKSCPALRSEAFTGSRIDQQLDEQARVFFADKEKNHFNAEKKLAYLSKILDWYQRDFGKNEVEVLQYIADFLPEKIANSIRRNPQEWKVKYTSYDWSLND